MGHAAPHALHRLEALEELGDEGDILLADLGQLLLTAGPSGRQSGAIFQLQGRRRGNPFMVPQYTKDHSHLIGKGMILLQ